MADDVIVHMAIQRQFPSLKNLIFQFSEFSEPHENVQHLVVALHLIRTDVAFL